jgi:hypothetical protein
MTAVRTIRAAVLLGAIGCVSIALGAEAMIVIPRLAAGDGRTPNEILSSQRSAPSSPLVFDVFEQNTKRGSFSLKSDGDTLLLAVGEPESARGRRKQWKTSELRAIGEYAQAVVERSLDGTRLVMAADELSYLPKNAHSVLGLLKSSNEPTPASETTRSHQARRDDAPSIVQLSIGSGKSEKQSEIEKNISTGKYRYLIARTAGGVSLGFLKYHATSSGIVIDQISHTAQWAPLLKTLESQFPPNTGLEFKMEVTRSDTELIKSLTRAGYVTQNPEESEEPLRMEKGGLERNLNAQALIGKSHFTRLSVNLGASTLQIRQRRAWLLSKAADPTAAQLLNESAEILLSPEKLADYLKRHRVAIRKEFRLTTPLSPNPYSRLRISSDAPRWFIESKASNAEFLFTDPDQIEGIRDSARLLLNPEARAWIDAILKPAPHWHYSKRDLLRALKRFWQPAIPSRDGPSEARGIEKEEEPRVGVPLGDPLPRSRNLYQRLGVAENAASDVIRSAAVKAEASQGKSNNDRRRMRVAAAVLLDPALRSIYDQSVHAAPYAVKEGQKRVRRTEYKRVVPDDPIDFDLHLPNALYLMFGVSPKAGPEELEKAALPLLAGWKARRSEGYPTARWALHLLQTPELKSQYDKLSLEEDIFRREKGTRKLLEHAFSDGATRGFWKAVRSSNSQLTMGSLFELYTGFLRHIDPKIDLEPFRRFSKMLSSMQPTEGQESLHYVNLKMLSDCAMGVLRPDDAVLYLERSGTQEYQPIDSLYRQFQKLSLRALHFGNPPADPLTALAAACKGQAQPQSTPPEL